MSATTGTSRPEGKPVLVCFALKEEANAFRKLAQGNPAVSILVTGMGRDNSRRALLERLKELTPAFVLTCGFAGGLNPNLFIGDVIFTSQDHELQAQLLATKAKPARVHCATRIATTVADKAQLRRETGADAVEMESAAFDAICRERGLRFAVVRAISDTAREDLPLDFNRLSRADWTLDYRKLAWTVIKSPGKIPALLRLQKNSRLAAERLAEVLRKVVAPDAPVA